MVHKQPWFVKICLFFFLKSLMYFGSFQGILQDLQTAMELSTQLNQLNLINTHSMRKPKKNPATSAAVLWVFTYQTNFAVQLLQLNRISHSTKPFLLKNIHQRKTKVALSKERTNTIYNYQSTGFMAWSLWV